MKQTEDLKVSISTGDRDSSCCERGEALGRGAWITLVEGKGALCLACSDLDHLIFLPSGNNSADPTNPKALDSLCGGAEVESCMEG